MRRIAIFGLVGLAMVGSSACGDDLVAEALAGLGEGCLVNSDCGGGNICVFQVCHQPCDTSDDCPIDPATGEHFNCFVGNKPESVCQLVVECEYHSDCEGHQVCASDRKCRDQCVSAQDCVPGQVCASGTCAEEHELVDGALPVTDNTGAEGAPCAYASDCEGNLVCHNGFCNVECKGDKDCGPRETCDDGVCVGPGGTGGAGTGGAGTGATGTGGTGNAGGEGAAGGAPDTCSNHVLDGGESDVDCGGPCFGCPTGSDCVDGSDCQNAVCGGANTCQVPTCLDTVKNGAETGIDCGGPACNPCPNMQPCTVPADCATGVCQGGQCKAAGCGDGIKNQGETGIDCGGPCGGCAVGQPCSIGGDCVQSVCSGGQCASATCLDGVQNGLETGADCGGGACSGCGVGAGCDTDSDCASQSCEDGGGVCLSPGCNDGAQNGFESDVDCGGQCPLRCVDGAGCFVGSDCDSGQCAGNVCQVDFELVVERQGTGSGAVTSNPAGIGCGNDCIESYAQGAQVTLTAVPFANNTFDGWGGTAGCVGTAPCVVSMIQAHNVTATFTGPGGGGSTWLTAVGTVPFNGYGAAAYGRLAAAPNGSTLLVAGFSGTATLPLGSISSYYLDLLLLTYDAGGAPVAQRRVGGDGNQYLGKAAFFTGGDIALTAITDTANVAFGNPANPLPCNEGGVYLGRYGANLALQWEECMAGQAETMGIAIDPADDSVVVVGRFFGTQDFDPAGGAVLSAVGYDWFVARYDGATGALLAAKRYGGAQQDLATAVDIDEVSGDVAVVGFCGSTVDFDGIVVPGVGGYDACIVSLDPVTLDAQWARLLGDTGHDYPTAVDHFANGDVLLTGTFVGSMIVDAIRPPLQSVGAEDYFVVVFDAAGTALVERALGSSGTDDYNLYQYLEFPNVLGRVTASGEVVLGGLCRNADFSAGAGPVGCSQGADGTWWARYDAGLNHQLEGVELNAQWNGDLIAPAGGGVRMIGNITGGQSVTFGGPQSASDNAYLVHLDL